jgi:hypothetical protein
MLPMLEQIKTTTKLLPQEFVNTIRKMRNTLNEMPKAPLPMLNSTTPISFISQVAGDMESSVCECQPTLDQEHKDRLCQRDT